MTLWQKQQKTLQIIKLNDTQTKAFKFSVKVPVF